MNNNIYDYFKIDDSSERYKKLTPAFYIKQRKNRKNIKGSKKYKKFVVGDIIEFLFIYKSVPLLYSGICIAIRKKSFLMPNTTIILRNIIMKVSIEITVFFFY